MCGLVGVVGDSQDGAGAAIDMLLSLLNRGPESLGFVVSGRTGVSHVPANDLLSNKDMEVSAVQQQLHGGSIISGHGRYSTSGSKDLIPTPLVWGTAASGRFALAHNGTLENWEELNHRYGISTILDSQTALEIIAHKWQSGLSFEQALLEALPEFVGAYSFLIQTRDALYAVRDPRGFRPLCLGKRNGAWLFASETIALEKVGAQIERNIERGEVLRCTTNGLETIATLPRGEGEHYCIFEHVYFSRPDSLVLGTARRDDGLSKQVANYRIAMGERLAQEHPVITAYPRDRIVIVPVPDSGNYAAEGFARESGLPLSRGLVRDINIGRTFMQKCDHARAIGVRRKLSVITRLITGMVVVLVDDSIMRGFTSHKIVHMVRAAGAAEVHMRISCPPTRWPCRYGVDFPTREELVAARLSVEEIRESINADSLGYLSLEDLRAACEEGPLPRYCTACYTGEYPTSQEHLVQL